jgi:hypothetical protein
MQATEQGRCGRCQRCHKKGDGGVAKAGNHVTRTADGLVAKRLVFHVGGYDPVPPDAVHRRFTRELRRFEKTWSASASVSPAQVGADEATWDVVTKGPNWRVDTHFSFVRWDDIIEAAGSQPMWRRIPLALLAFLDFAWSGALWGYLRTSWRYAAFFLYPFIIFSILVAVAWCTGALIANLTGSPPVGVATGLAAFVALLRWPGRRFYLPLLFDDWVFARAYVRGGNPILAARLDRIAREINAAVRRCDADEIVIVGHSLGAVLAVDLLDRALGLDPAPGRRSTRVVLLSIGSSILKIGLHREASRFRAALERVASATGVFWAEYQALTDVMNFYNTDPMAVLGLTTAGRPIVRGVRIRLMLDPAAYRRIRRNFYRVHCQFVSGNDRRAIYDYYMLICGPLPVERQVRSPDGAVSAIGPDGALLGTWHEHAHMRMPG